MAKKITLAGTIGSIKPVKKINPDAPDKVHLNIIADETAQVVGARTILTIMDVSLVEGLEVGGKVSIDITPA